MQAFRGSPRYREEYQPFSSSAIKRRKHNGNYDATYDYRTPNQRKNKHSKNKYSNKGSNNNKLDSDVEEEIIAQQLLYASDVDRAVDEIEHDDIIRKYVDNSDSNKSNNKYRELQGRSSLHSKRHNGNAIKNNGASFANNVSREHNYKKASPFRFTQPTRPLQSWEDDHDSNKKGERRYHKNKYNNSDGNNNVMENMYKPAHKLSERAAVILSNAHSATQPFSSAMSYASGQSNYLTDHNNTSFRSHVSPTEERIITEWMKHNNNTSSDQINNHQIVSPAPAPPLLSPFQNSFAQRRFSQINLISPRSDYIRLETNNHYINEPYYNSKYNCDSKMEDNNVIGTQYTPRVSPPLSPVPDLADEMEMIEDAAHARVARQLQLLKNKQRLDELDEHRRSSFSKYNSFVSSHNNDDNNNMSKKKIKMSPVHERPWESRSFPVKELVEAQVKQLQQLPMRENSPITVNNNYYFDTHTDINDNNNVSENEANQHTPNKMKPFCSSNILPAGISNQASQGKQLLSPRVSAAGLQTYSSVDSFESTSEQQELEEEEEEEEERRRREENLSPRHSSTSRNSTAVVVEYSNDREWCPVAHDNVLYRNTHNEPKLSPRYDVVENEAHEMHNNAPPPHSQGSKRRGGKNNNNETSSQTRYSPPRNSDQRRRRKKNEGHSTTTTSRKRDLNNKSKGHIDKSSGFLENELKKLSHAMSGDRANEYAHTPTSTTEEAVSSSSSFEEHKKRNYKKRNHNNNNNNKYNDEGEEEDDEDYFSSAKSEESSLESANNTSGNNMYRNNNNNNNDFSSFDNDHTAENYHAKRQHGRFRKNTNENSNTAFRNKRSDNNYRRNSHDHYDHAAGHSTSERINHRALRERETWEDAYQQETNTLPQTWSSASAVPPPRIIEHEQHRRSNFTALANNNNNNINNNYETKNTNSLMKENNNLITNVNKNKESENNDDVPLSINSKENQEKVGNDNDANNNNFVKLPHSRALYTPSTVDSELNGMKNNSFRSSSTHHHRSSQADRKNSITSKNNDHKENSNIYKDDDASHASKPKLFHSLSSPKMDKSKDDSHFNSIGGVSNSERNSLANDAKTKNNTHVANDSETHYNEEISYTHEGVDDDTPGNPQLQTSKPGSRGKVNKNNNPKISDDNNNKAAQNKERKPQEHLTSTHDRRNNRKAIHHTSSSEQRKEYKKNRRNGENESNSDADKSNNGSGNGSKLFVVEENANGQNNTKARRKIRRSYSYPPSSEYEESSSFIEEDYSSSTSMTSDVTSTSTSSNDDESDKMHYRKHRRARVPSQVTYTQTFRQGNSDEFTSSINPTTELDANTLLNGNRSNHNNKNNIPLNNNRNSNGVNRRSYSLRPASLSFPPPRPAYSLNRDQQQSASANITRFASSQLPGNTNIYNSINRIPASVSDNAVSFRSTPIRRTAINVNDPLLFTPSETSVNVHYNNNNNNNIYKNNYSNVNKPINVPQYVRNSMSALKSTSDALHSAQSAEPSNPLNSTSQIKKGLLYASLLPKTRASTPRTNVESIQLTSQENMPTAVIPILPPPNSDTIVSSSSALIAKEGTSDETGNKFATPASASNALPVQAQVHYVNNLNNNNNKVSTYERVDEAEMHRMDHGRWKKYATPKPFSSLFKPHNHDPYNYHAHSKHTKKNKEGKKRAFHSARSVPEPMVKVVSTRKNDTWHATPSNTQSKNNNNNNNYNYNYNSNNNHALQPYNEPFNINDSRDTSRVVKVVERRTEHIPHVQSSSSFVSTSMQQQHEQERPQNKERKLNKSKIQNVSSVSNKSLPSSHDKQPMQTKSATLSDPTSSLPTFVSSSYGVVGENRNLQPLVWTSGSSACVMSRNHQIPKPPHGKLKRHQYQSQMNANNMETPSATLSKEKEKINTKENPSSESGQGATLISDSRSVLQQPQSQSQSQSPQIAASLPAQPASVLSLTSKNTSADAPATTTSTMMTNSTSNANGETKAKSLQFEAKPVITSTPNKNRLYTQSYKERFHVQPLASETVNGV